MIEFQNIKKSFQEDFWKKPKVILENLSFTVGEGRVTGFVGHNGAGKTTLIKILMKFIKSDSGKCVFSDKLGSTFNEIKRNIGYLPERPYFYPDLTGKNFIYLLANLSGFKKNEISEQLSFWSESLSIDHALDFKIKTYSKGMLQRLGFISTIIHNPMFIILDEPLSGLDPLGRRELKDAIINLKNQGKTIFFSSHIIHDLEEVSDDIVVIDHGKLIANGPISSILQQQNEAVEIIVSDLPIEVKNSVPNLEVQKIGDRVKLRASSEYKNKILEKCVSNKVEVFSLNFIRPTLEQLTFGI